jgi:hypothetical protein
MAGFWAITVAIVSNAKSGLAVDEGSANTVMNGNVSGLFHDFAMIAILYYLYLTLDTHSRLYRAVVLL